MKILITGGSGYFGRLLIPILLKQDWVDSIVNLDEKPFVLQKPKYFSITKSLADNFEDDLKKFGQFEVILHLAYKIRRPYSKKRLAKWQKENLNSTKKIFQFALKNGIKKFIHTSTVAVYGAQRENNLNQKFTEETSLSDWSYDYAQNKKEIENLIKNLWRNSQTKMKLTILRVASVAGPKTKKFKKTGLFSFLKSKWPIIFYVREDSGRQYLHEQDLISAILFLLKKELPGNFLIFNLAPSDFLTFKEIAQMEKKIAFKVPYSFLKLVFSLAWHLSFGKIPTPPYAIDSFAFPIYVDGSKIENYGFHYQYSSKEAYFGKIKSRI